MCVRLLEAGVNPEALATVVQELRRETAAMKVVFHSIPTCFTLDYRKQANHPSSESSSIPPSPSLVMQLELNSCHSLAVQSKQYNCVIMCVFRTESFTVML